MVEYSIEKISKDESSKVLEFLRKFFFRDEPLNAEKKLFEKETDTCMELEDMSLECLYKGYSLKAVNIIDNRIIGVCLNEIISREDNLYDMSDHIYKNKKFAKIMELLKTIDKQANVFGQFPHIDRLLNIKILSVDNQYRGQGIAKEFINQSRQIAINNCVKMIRGDCSSHFSARVFKSLGFKSIYTLSYQDYCDNGVPIFTPAYPHTQAEVYVQEIY